MKARMKSFVFAGSIAIGGFVACNKTPSEPSPPKMAAATPPAAAPTSAPAAPSSAPANPNEWTLADATKNIPGSGNLVATITTNQGVISCKLLDTKAPLTVANFIGLAQGTRKWKAPNGQWVNTPAYDGTTFHRIIKGFMIQGGDAKGDGTGEPGYVVPDEIWAGATHDRVGQLCMANRGPNTNGQQFFITDAAATFLDGKYTIFGECTPAEVIHKIALVPVQGERPAAPVTIKSVTIARAQ